MEYNVFPQNLLRSYRILAFSWESLDGFFCSDAWRLAQGRDALMNWRALFERSELVRPPQAGVRPLS
jgi:hypothetical protein